MRVTDDDIAALRDLETAMWQTATRGDRSWMDRHLAPHFGEFGRSGRRYDRHEILTIDIGEIDIELPLADFSARALGPDTALTTYRSVEGRGPSNRSSVWRRTGTSWQMEFHHGSPTA